MDFKKNTASLWDDIRKTDYPDEYYIYHLRKEKQNLRWKRIRKEIIKKFGSIKGLKTIELGAGKGTYSLLLALEGADVTVLDYSVKGIEMSKRFFNLHNAKAKFVEMDALKLNRKLIGKFDVSMSFGTAEHFTGKKRLQIIESHIDVLNDDGITFIGVPNKWNLPYQLWKTLSRMFGRWQFGEEYPFSITEFKRIGRKINVHFKFVGSGLFQTKFNTRKRIRKLFGISEGNKIPKELPTPLDKYLAQDLNAYGRKIRS